MTMTGLSQKNRILIQFSSYFWSSMDWLYPPRCCNCDCPGVLFCASCQAELNVLSRNVCRKCGYPITSKKTLCEECRNDTPPFQAMRSWVSFSGPAKEALHSLKYKQNLGLGPILALPLVQIVQKAGWPVDLVIPIPLSTAHQKERGYNQAACISRAVARELNLPHSIRAVKRIKETKTQVDLDVNKRFMNLMDAFYANPAKLKSRNVLVIDDVITTGATMRSCAKSIMDAGAESVYCLSVARTLLRRLKKC